MEGKEQAVKELNEKFAIAVEELKKTYTKLCLFSAWSPRNVGIVFLECP